MMILRICVRNVWYDMELSDEEVSYVKEKNLADNILSATEITDKMRKLDANMPDSVIGKVVENATQHFIYRLTNYAVIKKMKEIEEAYKQAGMDIDGNLPPR